MIVFFIFYLTTENFLTKYTSKYFFLCCFFFFFLFLCQSSKLYLHFQEVLDIYLNAYPDSATAVNLRACNQYKLYNGKAAEKELRSLSGQNAPKTEFAKDFIAHNTVG